jgi:SOS-response transcriptional repressor LexA
MSIKERIGARLRAERKEARLTIKELSEKSEGEFKIARISNWEQGLRTPSPSDALKLANLLGVSAAYLMCLTDKKDATKQAENFITLLPVLTEEEIQQLSLAQSFEHVNGTRLPVEHEIGEYLSEGAFAYKLTDKSMSPVFEPGDTIVLDPKHQPKPGQYILAMHDNELIVRKIRDKGDEGIELLPANQDWPPIRLKSIDDLDFYSSVIEHRRNWL